MKKIKKAFFLVLLSVFLLFFANAITHWTFVRAITGLEIRDYPYCNETFGFPFVFQSHGKAIYFGEGGLHGDCFGSTDPLAYGLNISFWFVLSFSLIIGARSVVNIIQKQRKKTA